MLSRYLKLILILLSVNAALYGMIMQNNSDLDYDRFKLAYKSSFNIQDEAYFMELLDYKGINEKVDTNSLSLIGPISFLFCAVAESHSLEKISFLFNCGADIHEKLDDGTTLMHVASDIETIQFLQKKGLNIDVQNNNGETALLSSMVYADGRWMFFAKAGAKIDACDNAGYNLLHHFLNVAFYINPQDMIGSSEQDTCRRIVYSLRNLIEQYEVPIVKDKQGNNMFHFIAQKDFSHVPENYAMNLVCTIAGYLNLFCNIDEYNSPVDNVPAKKPIDLVMNEEHPLYQLIQFQPVIVSTEGEQVKEQRDPLSKATLSYVARTPRCASHHTCQLNVCNDKCDLVKYDGKKNINVLQTIQASQSGLSKRKRTKQPLRITPKN